MKLTDDKKLFLEKGYEVYAYDRQEMIQKTRKDPEWIHFGAGNLFRVYQAVIADKLLDMCVTNKGVIVVGGRNSRSIEDYYRRFDDLHIAVTLKSDGAINKRLVGSVAESVKIEETERLKEIFGNNSLKVASFTITEKGYKYTKEELNDPNHSYLGRITSLLYHRYRNGAYPLTMSSQDNCSRNGDVLKRSIAAFAEKYEDPGFFSYLDEKVSFPISMIDKITPHPDRKVADLLKKDGLEEIDLLEPDYYLNCYANAEESEYLVIEDDFANGRPLWDKAGVLFTDRETVAKTERMKVCTCLNPLHTALAIYGCLLGYHLICDEMKDEALYKLVKHLGYEEGLKVVTDPGIMDPKEFLDTVLEVRLKNPFMPDAPQRIATDTSQKLPVRFGETLKAYLERGLDIRELKYIPLVFAGWLRYLRGIDDSGKQFDLSSDPLLERLTPQLERYGFGNKANKEELKDLLSDSSIFGIDLIEYGFADQMIAYFNELNEGVGAIRRTLKKYV